MKHMQSLSHTTWDCKYHLVWIPKCRKEILYGHLRKQLGDVFKELALQKESEVIEGHLMKDHIHMMISILPKYAVSQVVGYIKGKSAIHIARTYSGRSHNFIGQNLWARGYYVSTTGRDQQAIRTYITKQKEVDLKIDQLSLYEGVATFIGGS
jgi:putative transposase